MLKKYKEIEFPFMFPLIFNGIDVHEIYLLRTKATSKNELNNHPVKKIPTSSSKDTLKPKLTPLKELL
jgi:hypothetical protein